MYNWGLWGKQARPIQLAASCSVQRGGRQRGREWLDTGRGNGLGSEASGEVWRGGLISYGKNGCSGGAPGWLRTCDS